MTELEQAEQIIAILKQDLHYARLAAHAEAQQVNRLTEELKSTKCELERCKAESIRFKAALEECTSAWMDTYELNLIAGKALGKEK